MPARHKSRQRALQVLFLWEQGKQSMPEAIEAIYATLGSEEDEPKRTPPDDFMEQLARGAAAEAELLDRRIAAKSENWRLDRMAAVDRNILRLAIYEMDSLNTPPAVAIDEAVELAREFSTDESAGFINGILDAVHRDRSAGAAP